MKRWFSLTGVKLQTCSHLSFGKFLQSRTLGQDPLNMLLLTCQPAPIKFWQVPSIKDRRARPFEQAITHMPTCSLSELYSLPNAHVIAGAGLL
jgi:hypothetical protein